MNNMKWFEKVCGKQDLVDYTDVEEHNHATLMHCTGSVREIALQGSLSDTANQSSNASQHNKTLRGTNEKWETEVQQALQLKSMLASI